MLGHEDHDATAAALLGFNNDELLRDLDTDNYRLHLTNTVDCLSLHLYSLVSLA